MWSRNALPLRAEVIQRCVIKRRPLCAARLRHSHSNAEARCCVDLSDDSASIAMFPDKLRENGRFFSRDGLMAIARGPRNGLGIRKLTRARARVQAGRVRLADGPADARSASAGPVRKCGMPRQKRVSAFSSSSRGINCSASSAASAGGAPATMGGGLQWDHWILWVETLEASCHEHASGKAAGEVRFATILYMTTGRAYSGGG